MNIRCFSFSTITNRCPASPYTHLLHMEKSFSHTRLEITLPGHRQSSYLFISYGNRPPKYPISMPTSKEWERDCQLLPLQDFSQSGGLWNGLSFFLFSFAFPWLSVELIIFLCLWTIYFFLLRIASSYPFLISWFNFSLIDWKNSTYILSTDFFPTYMLLVSSQSLLVFQLCLCGLLSTQNLFLYRMWHGCLIFSWKGLLSQHH